jgi:hypothetical protein
MSPWKSYSLLFTVRLSHADLFALQASVVDAHQSCWPQGCRRRRQKQKFSVITRENHLQVNFASTERNNMSAAFQRVSGRFGTLNDTWETMRAEQLAAAAAQGQLLPPPSDPNWPSVSW